MLSRTLVLSTLLAASMSAVGVADARARDVTDPGAPRSLPADGRIDVRWQDPAQFSELRFSGNRSEARRGDWIVQIAQYVRKRAEKRLPGGQRLDVEITDIKRAGYYEPWIRAGTDVRVVRDIYPPKIDLNFRLQSADGRVLAEGTRKLRDAAFMQRSTGISDQDPLRYEKAMIDRWITRDVLAPDA